MKRLSSKALTGLSAIILAAGGGAAGVYLRTGDAVKVDSVATQFDIPALSVPNSEPVAAISVSADTKIARIPRTTSILPYNDTAEGQADRTGLLRGMASTYQLPATADQAQVLSLVTTLLDSGLVFSSIEPASRAKRAPDASLAEVLAQAPELASIVQPDNSSSLNIPVAPNSAIVVASLPKKMTAGDTLDVQPGGYTRLPAGFCNIELRATPLSSARVQLRLHARCHPNTVVTIRHAGLLFREQLGKHGELALTIPAFLKYSLFNIELSDGMKASVSAAVRGLSRIERAGISWEGENTTFLHVYEPGSGRNGHIWRLTPRSYRESLLDGGGYMTLLGNPNLPRAAYTQIYSRPIQGQQNSRLITLTVETLIDASNCDKAFGIKTARHTSVSGFSGKRAVLKLPKCSSGSDSLISKNLVKDIRVAKN